MKIEQLLIKQNGKFISIIPGYELTECIKCVIQYCKENNTSEILEFNGQSNRIESYINAEDLARLWYYGASSNWYNEQKRQSRDNTINEILK